MFSLLGFSIFANKTVTCQFSNPENCSAGMQKILILGSILGIYSTLVCAGILLRRARREPVENQQEEATEVELSTRPRSPGRTSGPYAAL